MVDTVLITNVIVSRATKGNFVKMRSVSMIVPVMGYVKITNVSAQMVTSGKIALYMSVQITARNKALATVKLGSAHAILDFSETTARKKIAPTTAQEKVIAAI
jgi:hypothetical protein